MKSRSRKDDAFARILRANGNPEELDKILQSECRRRASTKLAATLLSAPDFRFPTKLSAEQCTADSVADFHASLVESNSRVVDLTAGLGIDSFHLARTAREVVCMDIEPAVADALRHNSVVLGLGNVTAHCADCREFINSYQGERFDVAFIDPARRADDGSRLYSLTQCKPDVVDMLPEIERIAHRLLIKASPMLDITQTCRELRNVKAVYAVGTRAECKELLIDIDFGYDETPELFAVTDEIVFKLMHEPARDYATDLKSCDKLGEPYPAVMKALSAGTIGGEQLGRSTFLFRNPDEETFPGKIYTVSRVEPFSSSTIRSLAKEKIAASVATRNFPLSAEELRRRLKTTESSVQRIIATTLSTGAQILAFLVPYVAKNS